MESISKVDKEILESLLKENKLNFDSILYRFSSEKYLKQNDDGSEALIANDEAVEMVVDTYKGHGHVFIAKEIGPGLSFLTEPLDEYEREGRSCVSAKVGELLAQGGLIYKVTSLPAYITAFFFTLPTGKVKVKRM